MLTHEMFVRPSEKPFEKLGRKKNNNLLNMNFVWEKNTEYMNSLEKQWTKKFYFKLFYAKREHLQFIGLITLIELIQPANTFIQLGN